MNRNKKGNSTGALQKEPEGYDVTISFNQQSGEYTCTAVK